MHPQRQRHEPAASHRDARAFDYPARRRRARDEPLRGARIARRARLCCTRRTPAAMAFSARRAAARSPSPSCRRRATHSRWSSSASPIMSEWFRRPANRGFDLYHAHDGISGNALASLRDEGLITAHVRTVHHVDAFGDQRVARLQARSIRTAHARFVVSTHWRRQLAETFGVEAEISGNGVDLARFSSSFDGSEARLRARLNLGDGPMFLSVGGVEARKNTVRILQAFTSRPRRKAVTRVSSSPAARACSITAPIRPNSVAQLARMGDGACRGRALPATHCRSRHAGPLPSRLRACFRFGQGGLRSLRARGDGERHRRSSCRASSRSSAISANPMRCGAIRSRPSSIAAAMRQRCGGRRRRCAQARSSRRRALRLARRRVAHLPVYRRLREPAHA